MTRRVVLLITIALIALTAAVPAAMAQAVWDVFERCIRETPEAWLWMYKHWRYRPAHPDRPYPFYSNFYRPFEDMVEANKVNASDQATL